MLIKPVAIISPWSRHVNNAKNYPYWNKLMFGLATKGWGLIQVGIGDERKLDGCEYKWNLRLNELEALVRAVGYFIACDNFLHHLAYSLGVQGVVLFGPSDPEIFGYRYPTQLNIIKSRELLRKDQFGFYKDYVWEHAREGWYEPEEIIKILEADERSKAGGVNTVESA
jgi:ADP-heptose:LPS heptosyltransferase